MVMKGKVTKTEIFLLSITAAFLLLVFALQLSGGGSDASSWYTVTPQKGDGAVEITVQKVNVNTADQEALQTLDGIGPVLAQRIIDWRESGGVFAAPEDLLLIEGIGEETLRQIRDYIITEEQP